MQFFKDLWKFDYVKLSFARNSMLFLTGILMYSLTTSKVKIIPLLAGILALNIAYSAIYLFNDLMDVEEDRKDKNKRTQKPLAKKDVSTRSATSIIYLLLVVGLAISVFVNGGFTLVLCIALLANFLHSSNYARGKEKNVFVVLALMFVMQSSKILMGWLSQTQSLQVFSFSALLFVTFIYVIGYYLFGKGRIRIRKDIDVKSWPETIFLFSGFFISTVLTLLYFPSKLLIVLVLGYAGLALVGLKVFKIKKVNKMNEYQNYLSIIVCMGIILLLFILSFAG